MSFDLATVGSYDDLVSVLRGLDISVPARTKGRTTHHTETWTICRLLSTLAKAGRVTFPLSVIHGDRPDFLLNNGNAKVGVEVTEAVGEKYATYCALAEREFPGVFLEPGHFRWGQPKLTLDEMRELLRGSQLVRSNGWVGDQAEQEWARFIQSASEAKLKKLARSDFDKFDKNWLSIYDNLPLPNIDLGKAVSFLAPLLQNSWRDVPCFDAVFVEHGAFIAEITAHGSNHLVVNDLWG